MVLGHLWNTREHERGASGSLDEWKGWTDVHSFRGTDIYRRKSSRVLQEVIPVAATATALFPRQSGHFGMFSMFLFMPFLTGV